MHRREKRKISLTTTFSSEENCQPNRSVLKKKPRKSSSDEVVKADDLNKHSELQSNLDNKERKLILKDKQHLFQSSFDSSFLESCTFVGSKNICHSKNKCFDDLAASFSKADSKSFNNNNQNQFSYSNQENASISSKVTSNSQFTNFVSTLRDSLPLVEEKPVKGDKTEIRMPDSKVSDCQSQQSNGTSDITKSEQKPPVKKIKRNNSYRCGEKIKVEPNSSLSCLKDSTDMNITSVEADDQLSTKMVLAEFREVDLNTNLSSLFLKRLPAFELNLLRSKSSNISKALENVAMTVTLNSDLLRNVKTKIISKSSKLEDLKNEDNSKKQAKQCHPNRRLELEKTSFGDDMQSIKCFTLPIGKNPQHNVGESTTFREEDAKCCYRKKFATSSSYTDVGQETKRQKVKSKSAEMWSEELENFYLSHNNNCWTENKERKTNYKNVLREFRKETLSSKYDGFDKTLWERKLLEKLQNGYTWKSLPEFYITPARVEVLSQQLVDTLTPKQALRLVCKMCKWPMPIYSPHPIVNTGSSPQTSFIRSCTLNGFTHIGATAASNISLAEELAANACLEWLGLKLRKPDDTLPLGTTVCEGTYF